MKVELSMSLSKMCDANDVCVWTKGVTKWWVTWRWRFGDLKQGSRRRWIKRPFLTGDKTARYEQGRHELLESLGCDAHKVSNIKIPRIWILYVMEDSLMGMCPPCEILHYLFPLFLTALNFVLPATRSSILH